MKIEQMSDEELLESIRQYAAREREATAALERVLREVDARWPGMRQGWPERIDDGGDVREGARRRRRRGGPQR